MFLFSTSLYLKEIKTKYIYIKNNNTCIHVYVYYCNSLVLKTRELKMRQFSGCALQRQIFKKTRIAERQFLTGLQRGYFFRGEGAAIHTQATIKPCR